MAGHEGNRAVPQHAFLFCHRIGRGVKHGLAPSDAAELDFIGGEWIAYGLAQYVIIEDHDSLAHSKQQSEGACETIGGQVPPLGAVQQKADTRLVLGHAGNEPGYKSLPFIKAEVPHLEISRAVMGFNQSSVASGFLNISRIVDHRKALGDASARARCHAGEKPLHRLGPIAGDDKDLNRGRCYFVLSPGKLSQQLIRRTKQPGVTDLL